jgi:hypothetical protein
MAILVQHLALATGPNPPPPVGTSADMFLHNNGGAYEIYNIGGNSVLAAYQLALSAANFQFAGAGGFFGTDTADLLLRNTDNGGFWVFDISNNNITSVAIGIGLVGLDWQVMGFGNFSSRGENDMILRNVNTGGIEVYDISNNQITGAAFMGTVGLNWQFSGAGNFSGRGESDMLLRNTSTGGLEVYDIANNQIINAAFIGTVGPEWQFSGVGNFSSVPGETDLLLRNVNTGGLELYDINNNQLTGAAFIGTVGLDCSSRASRRYTHLVRPISCCVTPTPAHSRFMTSPTIKSSAPPTWGRWDWNGSLAVSPPIVRPHRPHLWEAQVRPPNSAKRWRVSAVAAAQPSRRIPLSSAPPTHHSRRF